MAGFSVTGNKRGISAFGQDRTTTVVATCSGLQIEADVAMHRLYSLLLYLLDSTRAVIGQFSGPYSTVRPAKFKALFFAPLQNVL